MRNLTKTMEIHSKNSQKPRNITTVDIDVRMTEEIELIITSSDDLKTQGIIIAANIFSFSTI